MLNKKIIKTFFWKKNFHSFEKSRIDCSTSQAKELHAYDIFEHFKTNIQKIRLSKILAHSLNNCQFL